MRDELLAAVLADPSRENCAVYGDFLMEAGDPRGELIQLDLQLALHRTPALRRRRRELIDEHGRAWWGAFTGLVPASPPTRHGFLISATVSSLGLGSHAARLFACEPIQRLDVLTPGEAVDALLAAPWLSRLRALLLAGPLGDEDLVRTVSCPALAGLTELGLVGRGSVAAPGLGALVGQLPAVDSLIVRAHDFGARGARALAAWERLPRLRRLRLEQAEMGPNGVPALVAAGGFPVLEELSLAGNPPACGRELNGLAGRFPALTSLDLSDSPLGTADVEHLLQADWERLEKLKLTRTAVDAGGQAALRARFASRVSL